ncbi:glycoside hydrolase family 127 protein [Isoptericola sediminis]|uniref:Glycoside hydrolase family 127 protein n=1 Tax=Isoptericola sediminis TaxID=2733572 RepID=A0A849K8W2_9MICO|nr:beta-L-arabinofuranosidase domain-containing protein [Isoptericola sediminis]NNU27637.1 glycoside hydrolase family 127 protein [Isoptericola sediminis]
MSHRSSPQLRGRPVAPSTGALTPLGLHDVTITGGFWTRMQDLNATAIIDHAEYWMERVGWIGNFDAAVEGRLPADRQGREFSDSDVYKLMEAMAWEIGRTGDPGLERRFTALVDRIRPVQEPDGYLNTMFGRRGQQPRYSDFEWGHELYCFGHLIQAGVARARTHGHDSFVDIAVRAADHVCDVFGPDGLEKVGGHPEIETALVELGRHTGERRYLEQARLFLERRGHGLLGEIDFGPEYFQDDVPVRAAEVLRGHAVRALYLASGALDVAAETGDTDLLDAVTSQVARTVATRTYLTGGMGAHHEGESFGQDYELPPDRAYSETCAGVGAIHTAHRLLLADGGAEHADLVERVLYNVISASPAQDGRAFHYTNTLHQREPGTEPAQDEPSPRAASSLRAPWFAVSCCPTNVARTLSSLGAYVATTSADGLQVHQYASAHIRADIAGGVEVDVETRYPEDGLVRVRIAATPPEPWTLSLRVPGWCPSAVLRVGEEEREMGPGYADVRREWAVGDVVELVIPLAARWTWPHPQVDALRGQVAVERGPVVYCLESVDLGVDVALAEVVASDAPADDGTIVRVPVRLRERIEATWPYRPEPDAAAAGEVRDVTLVPYHAWANRGPSTMRVWMPVAD